MASIDNLEERAARRNCGYWATEANKIHLQKEEFSFEGREYLEEPMSSMFMRRCYMKGTQGGGSTVEILKSFHGMLTGYLPLGVLYLFPTANTMQDYSKAIMGPLIAANYSAIGKYLKDKKGKTEAASLKSVGKANLFMRGGGLPKKVEGEGESALLTGISVDKVVFDEIEQMEVEVIGKAIGRMGNSEVKEEVYIGNPGFPGRGIDLVFSGDDAENIGSDMRHWFRKCLHCGEWTSPEEDGAFPDCVKLRQDGTGYIGCKKCGKEVFVRDGEWVPAEREKSDYMHGYCWSQLTSPNNDPGQILRDFNMPPHGDLTAVMRLKLGKAFASEEDKLTTPTVFACCSKDVIMATSDDGPCAFGLDVGKVYHLVIGKRINQRTLQVIKIAQFTESAYPKSRYDTIWSEISEVIKQFNCKSGVIDIRPYESAARRFQQEQKHRRIYLCEYSENTTLAKQYNNNTGIVKVNRTEIFDDTHNLVSTEGMLVLPKKCPEVKEFARQVCIPAKREEKDEKTGKLVYRYRGKNDHYRNALNYLFLAADRKKLGIATSSSGHRKTHSKVMNEYARI